MRELAALENISLLEARSRLKNTLPNHSLSSFKDFPLLNSPPLSLSSPSSPFPNSPPFSSSSPPHSSYAHILNNNSSSSPSQSPQPSCFSSINSSPPPSPIYSYHSSPRIINNSKLPPNPSPSRSSCPHKEYLSDHNSFLLSPNGRSPPSSSGNGVILNNFSPNSLLHSSSPPSSSNFNFNFNPEIINHLLKIIDLFMEKFSPFLKLLGLYDVTSEFLVSLIHSISSSSTSSSHSSSNVLSSN